MVALRFLLALGLTLGGSGGALAGPEGPRAVVELFTSQACSASPPADRIMSEIAHRPDVIGLTLPVDYWDYLGWRDTLAKPAFSARQRAYASGRGERQVSTPQVVVNGLATSPGARRHEIERAVAGSTGFPIALEVAETGTAVVVEVAPAMGGSGQEADVWIVPVASRRQVAISRGENKGRVANYVNVVRDFIKVGTWKGTPARFEIPRGQARPANADTYVVLLQQPGLGGAGPILGAARAPTPQ